MFRANGLEPDTRSPRIAIASSGLGHVARGIEAWASDLGQALAERGLPAILCKGAGSASAEHERVIPCWTRESDKARRLVSQIPRALGWRVGLGSGYGIEQTTFAWHLIKVLRQERIDILHVQDPQIAVLMQWARTVGWIRARTILAHGTEESFDFQRRITYLQHLAPWHLEQARAAGIARSTWTVIPNFIDTERFSPGRTNALRRELGIPSDALIVLTASAIKRHHKRVDYVLAEFAALLSRRPELPAWLIIAGGWEQETDALVEEGKRLLGDRVRFLMRFPRSRMPDLYRAADAFALGSLKEMMPIALLEAIASGLPCLVNRHPVMEWMIGPGGCAHDLSREGSLATALAAILSRADQRTELGREARKHCLAHFSRNRVVDEILNYYQQVAGAPTCRTASVRVS